LSLKGVYEEADSLYKKVHELNPENAICLVDRGNTIYIFLTVELQHIKYFHAN